MKPCSEHANIVRRLDLITTLLIIGLVGSSGLARIMQGWLGSPTWMEVLESMLAPILILILIWVGWEIYFRYMVNRSELKTCEGCKK
jgi:uncharacterized membrane protein YhdT